MKLSFFSCAFLVLFIESKSFFSFLLEQQTRKLKKWNVLLHNLGECFLADLSWVGCDISMMSSLTQVALFTSFLILLLLTPLLPETQRNTNQKTYKT